MTKPGLTLGGALAFARWAPSESIALVPQLELLLARRTLLASTDGNERRSHGLDLLELPLLLRGELKVGSHLLYLTGGVYGSALLRAQTLERDGTASEAATSSRVDIGWLAAGGFTLARLGSGEMSVEFRYQRGHRALLLESDERPRMFSILLGYGLHSLGSQPSSSPGKPSSLALQGGLITTRLGSSQPASSPYRPVSPWAERIPHFA